MARSSCRSENDTKAEDTHASLIAYCVCACVCFRAVTESINQLITLCTQQAAGQKECDNALRELEVAVRSYAVASAVLAGFLAAYVACCLPW